MQCWGQSKIRFVFHRHFSSSVVNNKIPIRSLLQTSLEPVLACSAAVNLWRNRVLWSPTSKHSWTQPAFPTNMSCSFVFFFFFCDFWNAYFLLFSGCSNYSCCFQDLFYYGAYLEPIVLLEVKKPARSEYCS